MRGIQLKGQMLFWNRWEGKAIYKPLYASSVQGENIICNMEFARNLVSSLGCCSSGTLARRCVIIALTTCKFEWASRSSDNFSNFIHRPFRAAKQFLTPSRYPRPGTWQQYLSRVYVHWILQARYWCRRCRELFHPIILLEVCVPHLAIQQKENQLCYESQTPILRKFFC